MHNINQTLDGIIRYGTTHINLSNIESKRDFNYYLEHILPDVITSLRFLKISNDFLFDKEQEALPTEGQAIMIGIIKKVQAKVDLNAYKKLEELRLENVDGTQLKLISEKLIHMSQLKRLVISFYGTTAAFFTSVIDSAIIRSKLKILNLTLIDANVLFPNSSSQNTLSNLDYLTVQSCIIGNVAGLFKLVQNIKYLDISIWNYPDKRQTYLTDNLTLPNLTHLKLKVDEIQWSFLEHLLKQCGKQLTHLTLEGK
jgi:Leucine-rich repeat (LRR) protein